jgi:hypothetical protein
LEPRIEELNEELKNDRKISKQIFEFLKKFISVDSNSHLSRLKNWSSWSNFEEKYDFVPYVVKVPDFVDGWNDEFYQVLGVFNFKGTGKSLKEIFPEIGEEKFDLSLSKEKIEQISNSKELNGYSLALLNEVNLCKNYWYKDDNIFNLNSELYKFNGGSDVNFGENCKRVFSKVYSLDKGCYLCEGFIMKHGDHHDKGLVLRFTYGHLVEKEVEKK